MSSTHAPTELIAAQAGDREAFSRLTEPHRSLLLAHCYRMLGSLQDAEDLVQETLLRAWQRVRTFEGRSSLRTWLYAIATNACLNALDRRPRRLLPAVTSPPSAPDQPFAPPTEPVWLEPFPDRLLAGAEPSPEARYTAQESITLAFLMALQRLPPRQRAVLLLREVLAWRADEVADLLESTVPAINSLLHRARATLAQQRAAGLLGEDQPTQLDAATQQLLDRYMQVWEMADIPGLLALLKEDATLAMPPSPSWYRGRTAIGVFAAGTIFGAAREPFFPGPARGRWRLRPTRANGLPAFGLYRRVEHGPGYAVQGIELLRPAGDQVAEIIAFLSPGLISYFGLPESIES